MLPCLSQHIRSVRYHTATQVGGSTQARHKVNCPTGARAGPLGGCVGNDTSHGGRGDFFARKRTPSPMQSFSKKRLAAFSTRCAAAKFAFPPCAPQILRRKTKRKAPAEAQMRCRGQKFSRPLPITAYRQRAGDIFCLRALQSGAGKLF